VQAVYWTGYEFVKRSLTKNQPLDVPPPVHISFIAGATSGAVAATLTTPFDVIKTQFQVELGQQAMCEHKTAASSKLKLSNFALISEIVASQGVKGLFVGLIPRVAKVAPACAIMISSYEYFKGYFQSQNEDDAFRHGT
jgi:solute carrier family 25 protein 39/40